MIGNSQNGSILPKEFDFIKNSLAELEQCKREITSIINIRAQHHVEHCDETLRQLLRIWVSCTELIQHFITGHRSIGLVLIEIRDTVKNEEVQLLLHQFRHSIPDDLYTGISLNSQLSDLKDYYSIQHLSDIYENQLASLDASSHEIDRLENVFSDILGLFSKVNPDTLAAINGSSALTEFLQTNAGDVKNHFHNIDIIKSSTMDSDKSYAIKAITCFTDHLKWKKIVEGHTNLFFTSLKDLLEHHYIEKGYPDLVSHYSSKVQRLLVGAESSRGVREAENPRYALFSSLEDLEHFLQVKILSYKNTIAFLSHEEGFSCDLCEIDLDFLSEHGKLPEETSQKYGFVYRDHELSLLSFFIDVLEMYANTDYNILITGERGTGKELAAKAIAEISQIKPSQSLNCANLSETLADSLLFGHEKGAFSGAYRQHIGFFEKANGGILFLDEVATLPLATQSKLLRALQEKTITRLGGQKEIHVDVRVIAATNQSIESEGFRQDLKDRLGQLSLETVPLRDQHENIPLIAVDFVSKEAKRLFNRKVIKSQSDLKLTFDDLIMLSQKKYEGNVRDLLNEVRSIIARKVYHLQESQTPKSLEAILTMSAMAWSQEVGKFTEAHKTLIDLLEQNGEFKKGIRRFTYQGFIRWKNKDKEMPVPLKEGIYKKAKNSKTTK
jgi:transcriptional regulator with AAA-type ATPase domain/Asp-tRNA(Asn)/Glu-tRNA(Gln) amidotransferase C subunit